MRALLYVIFVLSGAAGLIYESVWTRYLGLFVGHSAYAQVIVLTIFLGGMALGAHLIGRRSERVTDPLVWYAVIEVVVGLIGLFFDDIYGAATRYAYGSLFPAAGSGVGVLLAKWTLAALLILPQSVLLGTTFPLMTAGVLRRTAGQPGRVLSLLYFSNSFGAAVGVLLAGFWLVRLAGLPGTLVAAAILNLVVGLVALTVARYGDDAAEAAVPEPAAAAPSSGDAAGTAAADPRVALRRLLLAVAFGTAVASFAYEIAWIRMLSLVLGSATHSFELMLSAFILGLALGALWVHRRADRLTDPRRTLGIVQWVMGFAALATLPLYLLSFDATAGLVRALDQTEAGYGVYTLARYAICLVVMLPSTFCAGMTLPLITRTLVTSGEGERAVGRVYAVNTLGSIVGVVLASLVLLPLVGVRTLLVAGAALDMLIGVWLLLPAAGLAPAAGRLAGRFAVATVAVCAAAFALQLDPATLTSGVFRHGRVGSDSTRMLYLKEGRTAQVAVTQQAGTRTRVLATNGKPDASLDTTWLAPAAGTRPQALRADMATQLLLPLITLAHRPDARQAAVIGFGSGISSHVLLSSRTLDTLVTIEIEPRMIEAAREAFHPANRRAYDDPRSRFVVDDAKAYFAATDTRFDLILSEPSNPWVSGVSGLFTEEFYARVGHYLADGGVFGQWLHMYEIDDALVTSVLGAIHRQFGAYEIYQTSGGDLLIVATKGERLARPDWRVAAALGAEMPHVLAPTPERLDALHLVGSAGLAPMLAALPAANSDYYPVLDLGAERSRYLGAFARGFRGVRAALFDLPSAYAGTRRGFSGETEALVPEIGHAQAAAVSAVLQRVLGGEPVGRVMAALPVGHAARPVLQKYWAYASALTASEPPVDWSLWLQDHLAMHEAVHGGTSGVRDARFAAAAEQFVVRHGGPAEVRTAVRFMSALAGWDWRGVIAEAPPLLAPPADGRPLLPPDLVRDGLVLAHLKLGEVDAARRRYDGLASTSRRAPTELNSLLLGAYLSAAEGPAPAVPASRVAFR